MRLLTSFIFLLTFTQNALAQDCVDIFDAKKQLVVTTMLCPSAMIADLTQLHKHILETHPDPTYYGELNDLSNAFQNAKASMSQPLSVFDFMLVINKYLSVLKDSHSGINPKQFLYSVNPNRQVLPFFVEQIDGHFFISSAHDSGFLIGAELLQIDGFKVAQLFDLGKALSLNEGDATAARDEIASEYMSVAYNLRSMSLKTPRMATVTCVDLKGDTIQQTIPFTASWKYFLSTLFEGQEDNVNFIFDEQNNGILTINSFEPLSLSHFKKQIDAFFSEVKQRNCQNVYIDLRNNLGGLLRAEEYLYSYINTNKTPIQTNYLYKRSDYDRFALLTPMQQMQFVNRAKNVYPNGLISKEYDFYKLPKGATHTILYDYIPQNNLDYIFKGDCKLILNENSMSASVLFAGWFRHIQRGEILGATCMGGMGGTFGNPAVITLAHSQIDVMVSTLKFTPLHVQERVLAPIEPDVPLKATREDILERRDPFLRYLKGYQK
ncbi:MAG: S41 family peptidase [Sphingomonadales bacterium]